MYEQIPVTFLSLAKFCNMTISKYLVLDRTAYVLEETNWGGGIGGGDNYTYVITLD